MGFFYSSGASVGGEIAEINSDILKDIDME